MMLERNDIAGAFVSFLVSCDNKANLELLIETCRQTVVKLENEKWEIKQVVDPLYPNQKAKWRIYEGKSNNKLHVYHAIIVARKLK